MSRTPVNTPTATMTSSRLNPRRLTLPLLRHERAELDPLLAGAAARGRPAHLHRDLQQVGRGGRVVLRRVLGARPRRDQDLARGAAAGPDEALAGGLLPLRHLERGVVH